MYVQVKCLNYGQAWAQKYKIDETQFWDKTEEVFKFSLKFILCKLIFFLGNPFIWCPILSM